MIEIKKKANIITISGHANYCDDYDIVCASVSSIMYTTVNAIMRFNKHSINYKDDKKVVTIEIIDETLETKVLITNMFALLIELASKYPKNIKIESEEYTC